MMQELYTVMSVAVFIKNSFFHKTQNCMFTAWQISLGKNSLYLLNIEKLKLYGIKTLVFLNFLRTWLFVSWQVSMYFHKSIFITSYLLLILYRFYNIPSGPSNTLVLLLHNRDFSEYVIPYRSFDESFNYPKQSQEISTYKKQRNKLVANTLVILMEAD